MGDLFSHLPFTDGEIFEVVVVSFIIPGLFRLKVFPPGLMWALTIKIRLFLDLINPLKARYTMYSHASPSGFKVLINSRVYLILSFKFWVKMIPPSFFPSYLPSFPPSFLSVFALSLSAILSHLGLLKQVCMLWHCLSTLRKCG